MFKVRVRWSRWRASPGLRFAKTLFCLRRTVLPVFTARFTPLAPPSSQLASDPISGPREALERLEHIWIRIVPWTCCPHSPHQKHPTTHHAPYANRPNIQYLAVVHCSRLAQSPQAPGAVQQRIACTWQCTGARHPPTHHGKTLHMLQEVQHLVGLYARCTCPSVHRPSTKRHTQRHLNVTRVGLWRKE